jgi:hypothetical protein
MAALNTFLELQDQVLLLAGMSGTTDRDLVKDAINIALNDFWSRYPWPFKRVEGWGATRAPYSTGTVEANAADQLTLTGGTWPTDVVGMKIGIPGLTSPWYRVKTRVSGAIVIVDHNIPNYATTVPAGTDYYAYSDEVDLSDITDLETLNTQHVWIHDQSGQGNPLIHVPRTATADWGFPRGSGRPVSFSEAMTYKAATGPVLHVGPLAPDKIYQIRLAYDAQATALTNDLDEPIIPARMRHILVTGALREIYRQDEFRDTPLARQAEEKFERDLRVAWRQEKRARPRVQYVRPFDSRRLVGGLTFVIDNS